VPHEFQESPRPRSPEDLADVIGRGAKAILEAQPGTSERSAQTEAIRGTTALPRIDLESLGHPDTEASEHIIWHAPSSGYVIKATAYGRFGHDFDRRKDGNLPLDYIERMALSNRHLGDTVEFIGKFEDDQGNVGLLLSQKFVCGGPMVHIPTETQVDEYFARRGFSKHATSPGRYVNEAEGIEVDDTHPGNFIIDENGTLVPIDILVRQI
jgi:hypothetical protein